MAESSDELEAITEGVAMWRTVLDDAERLVWSTGTDIEPETEIRLRMPMLLASCSPQARKLMRDQLLITEHMVAGYHHLRHELADYAPSSRA